MIYRIFKKSYFDNSFKKSGKIESGQKKSGKIESDQKKSGKIESEQKKSGKIESGYKKSGKIESEQKKSGKIERVSEQSAVVGKYHEDLFNGVQLSFDLTKGQPCFRMNKDFTVLNIEKFKRKIKTKYQEGNDDEYFK